MSEGTDTEEKFRCGFIAECIQVQGREMCRTVFLEPLEIKLWPWFDGAMPGQWYKFSDDLAPVLMEYVLHTRPLQNDAKINGPYQIMVPVLPIFSEPKETNTFYSPLLHSNIHIADAGNLHSLQNSNKLYQLYVSISDEAGESPMNSLQFSASIAENEIPCEWNVLENKSQLQKYFPTVQMEIEELMAKFSGHNSGIQSQSRSLEISNNPEGIAGCNAFRKRLRKEKSEFSSKKKTDTKSKLGENQNCFTKLETAELSAVDNAMDADRSHSSRKNRQQVEKPQQNEEGNSPTLIPETPDPCYTRAGFGHRRQIWPCTQAAQEDDQPLQAIKQRRPTKAETSLVNRKEKVQVDGNEVLERPSLAKAETIFTSISATSVVPSVEPTSSSPSLEPKTIDEPASETSAPAQMPLQNEPMSSTLSFPAPAQTKPILDPRIFINDEEASTTLLSTNQQAAKTGPKLNLRPKKITKGAICRKIEETKEHGTILRLMLHDMKETKFDEFRTATLSEKVQIKPEVACWYKIVYSFYDPFNPYPQIFVHEMNEIEPRIPIRYKYGWVQFYLPATLSRSLPEYQLYMTQLGDLKISHQDLLPNLNIWCALKWSKEPTFHVIVELSEIDWNESQSNLSFSKDIAHTHNSIAETDGTCSTLSLDSSSGSYFLPEYIRKKQPLGHGFGEASTTEKENGLDKAPTNLNITTQLYLPRGTIKEEKNDNICGTYPLYEVDNYPAEAHHNQESIKAPNPDQCIVLEQRKPSKKLINQVVVYDEEESPIIGAQTQKSSWITTKLSGIKKLFFGTKVDCVAEAYVASEFPVPDNKKLLSESNRIDEKNNDGMKELATKAGTKFTSYNSDRPASSDQTSNNNFNHLTSSNGNTNACSIGINTNQLENSSACLVNNVPHSSWPESVELSSSNNSLSLNKAPPPPTVAKPMVAYLQIPSQYFPWIRRHVDDIKNSNNVDLILERDQNRVTISGPNVSDVQEARDQISCIQRKINREKKEMKTVECRTQISTIFDEKVVGGIIEQIFDQYDVSIEITKSQGKTSLKLFGKNDFVDEVLAKLQSLCSGMEVVSDSSQIKENQDPLEKLVSEASKSRNGYKNVVRNENQHISSYRNSKHTAAIKMENPITSQPYHKENSKVEGINTDMQKNVQQSAVISNKKCAYTTRVDEGTYTDSNNDENDVSEANTDLESNYSAQEQPSASSKIASNSLIRLNTNTKNCNVNETKASPPEFEGLCFCFNKNKMAVFLFFYDQKKKKIGEYRAASLTCIPNDCTIGLGVWYQVRYSKYSEKSQYIRINKIDLVEASVLASLPLLCAENGYVKICVVANLSRNGSYVNELGTYSIPLESANGREKLSIWCKINMANMGIERFEFIGVKESCYNGNDFFTNEAAQQQGQGSNPSISSRVQIVDKILSLSTEMKEAVTVIWQLNKFTAFFVIYSTEERKFTKFCESSRLVGELKETRILRVGDWYKLRYYNYLKNTQHISIHDIMPTIGYLATKTCKNEVKFCVEARRSYIDGGGDYFNSNIGTFSPVIDDNSSVQKPPTLFVWCKLGAKRKFTFVEIENNPEAAKPHFLRLT